MFTPFPSAGALHDLVTSGALKQLTASLVFERQRARVVLVDKWGIEEKPAPQTLVGSTVTVRLPARFEAA